MSKKRLGFVVSLLLVLAGCGGSGTSDIASAAAGANASAATAAGDTGQVAGVETPASVQVVTAKP